MRVFTQQKTVSDIGKNSELFATHKAKQSPMDNGN